MLGARFGHCLFYGPWFDEFNTYGQLINEGYLSHPLNMLKVYEGGLASHGGAIGIIVAMILYCRKQKENWLWLFDRLVIVVPLTIIRIVSKHVLPFLKEFDRMGYQLGSCQETT